MRQDFSVKSAFSRQHYIRFGKLILICAAATAANYLLSTFALHFMDFPLFLDTLFTVAVTFAAGLIPGIVVAVLTWITAGVLNAYFNPFVPVILAEVLLVHWLKPAPPQTFNFGPHESALRTNMKIANKINTAARLALLYLACAIVVSVLGGLICFLFYTVGGREAGQFFPTIDTLRMGFLRDGAHLLTANILSRLLVNMTDRLFVIFGGYLVALGIKRILQGKFQIDPFRGSQ